MPVPFQERLRRVSSVPVQSREPEANPRTLEEIKEANGHLSDAIVDHFSKYANAGSRRDYGDGRTLLVTVIRGRFPELHSLSIILYPHAVGQQGYHSLERVKEHTIESMYTFSGTDSGSDVTFVFPTPNDTEDASTGDSTKLKIAQAYNGILNDVARVYEIDVNTSPSRDDASQTD